MSDIVERLSESFRKDKTIEELRAEIERLRAALQEAARRLIANGDGYGANEATRALEPKP